MWIPDWPLAYDGWGLGYLFLGLAALGKEAPPNLTGLPVVAAGHPKSASHKQPEAILASQALSQPNLEAPPVGKRQPPAAPAATEAASVHLARWAPHPSADTTPGTEPSPRMPAPETVPPRQMPVDEATSVRAATPPVAVPSSLPVADSGIRRAAEPLVGRTWLIAPELIFAGVQGKEGKSRTNHARETRTLLGGEDYNVGGIGNQPNVRGTPTVVSHRLEEDRVHPGPARFFFPKTKIHNRGRRPPKVPFGSP